MNINIFFTLLFFALGMIFVFFKPLNIKQQVFKDVPLFNLKTFTMHELNTEGLATLMMGTEATRYSNRYRVKNIDYTDNTKEYIANMKANDGIYRNEIVDLKGDVIYFREDGLTFESQVAKYNKKTSVAHVNAKYVSYRNDDRIKGSSLIYNNKLNRVKSKNVIAKYQLKER